MQGRIKRDPLDIEPDEYLDLEAKIRLLNGFFDIWRDPDRPDPQKELDVYIVYLSLMSHIFNLQENLVDAIEKRAYQRRTAHTHAHIYLYIKQIEATQVLEMHLSKRLKLPQENIIEDGNAAREVRANALQVTEDALQATRSRYADEHIHLHFNQTYRGLYVLDSRIRHYEKNVAQGTKNKL